jgi:hypothetical protein
MLPRPIEVLRLKDWFQEQTELQIITSLKENKDTRRIVMEKMEVMYFIYFSVALLMANGIIQYRMTKNLELKIKNK